MGTATLARSTKTPAGPAVSDLQFERICSHNPDWRLERTAEGDLAIMPPAGGESGAGNAALTAYLYLWTRRTGLGICFDSSTGFRLPNGAIRSPDAAWVAQERWEALTPEERRSFLPLCPDFAIELRSASDTRESVRDKMQEYVNNGLRLGWLIDPIAGEVEIYRSGKPPETLHGSRRLSGEDVLPGFDLDLSEVLG